MGNQCDYKLNEPPNELLIRLVKVSEAFTLVFVANVYVA